MTSTHFRALLIPAVFVLLLAGVAAAQEKADTAKVAGTWRIDIYVGDMTYTLKLDVTDTDGQLAGKVSESMGTFTDLAVSDIYYDGDTFRFNFNSPTPPDGNMRTVQLEFKVGLDQMDGMVFIPDLEVTAEARASR